MEEIVTRGMGGLSLEDLEAHGRAELLPDRIEMMMRRRRRRGGGGNVNCGAANVAGGNQNATNTQNCNNIQLFGSSASASASAGYFAGSASATGSAMGSAMGSATASATASALAATGGPPAAPIAGAAAAGIIASGLAALRLVRRRDAS